MEELTNENLNTLVNNYVLQAISESLEKNKALITQSVDDCVKETVLTNKLAYFKESLDWAVEYSIRDGFTKVMKELHLADLIANKVKALLSDDEFVKSLAEYKIKTSLGIPVE